MVSTTTDNSGRRAGAIDAALWVLVILWVLALTAVVALLFGNTP
jgi:hypothetical protein